MLKRERKSLGGPNQGPAGSQSGRPRTLQLLLSLAIWPTRNVSRLEVAIRKPNRGVHRPQHAPVTEEIYDGPAIEEKMATGRSFYTRARILCNVHDKRRWQADESGEQLTGGGLGVVDESEAATGLGSASTTEPGRWLMWVMAGGMEGTRITRNDKDDMMAWENVEKRNS